MRFFYAPDERQKAVLLKIDPSEKKGTICDQISDAVLDAMLAQDPMSRVACETATTTGMVLVMGEITTKAQVDIASIVRRTVADIGYNDPSYGFDANSIAVFTTLDKQSPDIAMGVDTSYELQSGGGDEADRTGAGDQGMMFGYACRETKELMPAPIALSHNLTLALARQRKSGALPWLRPDGKSQVTVAYDENGQVEWCPAIVVSTQHRPFCGGRPRGRLRSHGTKDHRGHLRRRCGSRRRLFLRKGPHQGGPLSCLYGPVCG